MAFDLQKPNLLAASWATFASDVRENFRAWRDQDTDAGAVHCGAATASSTIIENTASETTFSKSRTLAANLLRVGSYIVIRASGRYSGDATTPGNVTLRAKIGGTTFATSSTLTVASVTTYPWELEVGLLVTAIGAAGSARMVSGFVALLNGGSRAMIRSAASVAINTTGTLAVALSAQLSVADLDNEIYLDTLRVDVLHAQDTQS